AQNCLEFFSRQCAKPVGSFSPETETALQSYAWPGNLRELRNVVERAVILAGGERIELQDLPEQFTRNSAAPAAGRVQLGATVSLEELEAEHIKRVVEQSASLEEAAAILG